MLTPAQKTTLKTDIQANFPSPNEHEIAVAYNLSAAPDFWVWKSSVTKGDLTNSPSIDATTFNWTGTGFITRSVGERDAWRELFSADGTVNPSLPNVRQAFADIFSGATAPAPANRTHLLTVGRRKATRVEKLLATGTGSTAVPATMGFEGVLTTDDVVDALR